MILLSNGGTNTHMSGAPSDAVVVGTADGVAVLHRKQGRWEVAHTRLRGCFISAVTQAPSGTLFAASHGVGVARSRDVGMTWAWCNDELAHYDRWAARAGRLQGRGVVCVGSLPANVYLSEDDGDTGRPLPALREVA